MLVFVVLVFYFVVFFGYAGSLFLHLDFSLVVVSRGGSPSPVCGRLIAVASGTLASTVAVNWLRCPAACESHQARPQTRVSCIGRSILNRCTTSGVLSALSESKQTPLQFFPARSHSTVMAFLLRAPTSFHSLHPGGLQPNKLSLYSRHVFTCFLGQTDKVGTVFPKVGNSE